MMGRKSGMYSEESDLFTDERSVSGELMGDNYYGSGSELMDIPRLTIRCDSERLSVQLLSPHPETTEYGVPAEISVMIRFGNQQMTVETWERFLPLKTYDILTSKQT